MNLNNHIDYADFLGEKFITKCSIGKKNQMVNFENVVAQELVGAGHSLYYYTFKEQCDAKSEPRRYEVDFLIASGHKVCPIEVKSSGYKSHKSLDLFSQKFSSRIKTKYLLYTKDIRKEQDIICLPVYMAGLL